MPRIHSKVKTLAIDCETTGLDVYHGARPFFVTVCDEEGEQRFWEWEVDPLTRKVDINKGDADQIRIAIREADRIVGQNIKFDVAMLREAGIVEDWSWEKTEDTIIAGHLMRSNQAHDLTTMALVYLGTNIAPFEDDMEIVVKKARNWARKHAPDWRIARDDLPEMPSAMGDLWKNDMWILYHYEDGKHAHLVRDYANADSAVTIKLWQHFEASLKSQGLWEIYRERMKAIPVAVDMERRGVTLSGTRLEEQVGKYTNESVRAGKMCCSIARTYDYELKLPKSGNNGSLGKFCFETMKLPVVTKSKKTGVPSIDSKVVIPHWLDTLEPESKQYRFVKNLSDKRKRDTAIAYMTGYKKFWLPILDEMDREYADGLGAEIPGRDWYVLHPSLNPTGTDTLRWSSSNPNEQNISAKEDFNLRYSFGPAPGREWWSLDYRNIELRIPGYKSGEKNMIELFENPDEPPYFGSYHLLNCSIIFPEEFWPVADKKDEFENRYKPLYKRGKNTGFAIQYGCQEAKADATAGRKGAFEAIKKALPAVTRYTEEVIAFANKHGYVETLIDRSLGAKRGYPLWCTRSSWGGVSPTIPLSYLVQGTAMQCTTKAMPRCKDYLDHISQETKQDYFISLQVHDELVLDTPVGGKKNLPIVEKVQRIMEKSGEDIEIPLKVGVTHHPENWSEGTKCGLKK